VEERPHGKRVKSRVLEKPPDKRPSDFAGRACDQNSFGRHYLESPTQGTPGSWKKLTPMMVSRGPKAASRVLYSSQLRPCAADQPISATPGRRGKAMNSRSSQVTSVSVQIGASTPTISFSPTPLTRVAGSHSYAAWTLTWPAQSSP